jgi:hypothetical protein
MFASVQERKPVDEASMAVKLLRSMIVFHELTHFYVRYFLNDFTVSSPKKTNKQIRESGTRMNELLFGAQCNVIAAFKIGLLEYSWIADVNQCIDDVRSITAKIPQHLVHAFPYTLQGSAFFGLKQARLWM